MVSSNMHFLFTFQMGAYCHRHRAIGNLHWDLCMLFSFLLCVFLEELIDVFMQMIKMSNEREIMHSIQ